MSGRGLVRRSAVKLIEEYDKEASVQEELKGRRAAGCSHCRTHILWHNGGRVGVLWSDENLNRPERDSAVVVTYLVVTKFKTSNLRMEWFILLTIWDFSSTWRDSHGCRSLKRQPASTVNKQKLMNMLSQLSHSMLYRMQPMALCHLSTGWGYLSSPWVG